MEDLTILGIMAIFTAAAFAISFMRLWFVTNYDAGLSGKVKGLRLSFDKLRKDLKTQLEESSNDLREMEAEETKLQLNDLGGIDLSNMTLEEAAGSIGIDVEQLNNPLIRPMAEKVFEQIKTKAKEGGNVDRVGTETGY